MTIRGHVHGVSLSSILIPVRAERCPEFSDMARPTLSSILIDLKRLCQNCGNVCSQCTALQE